MARSNRLVLAALTASRPEVQAVTTNPIAVNRIFTNCNKPSSSSITRICSCSMRIASFIRLRIGWLRRRWRHDGGRRTDGTDLLAHFLVDTLQCFELARQLVDFFVPLGELLLKRLNIRSLNDGVFRRLFF